MLLVSYICVCIDVGSRICLKFIGQIEAKRARGDFSQVQVCVNTFSMALEGTSGSQPLEHISTLLFDGRDRAAVMHQVSRHQPVTFLCL